MEDYPNFGKTIVCLVLLAGFAKLAIRWPDAAQIIAGSWFSAWVLAWIVSNEWKTKPEWVDKIKRFLFWGLVALFITVRWPRQMLSNWVWFTGFYIVVGVIVGIVDEIKGHVEKTVKDRVDEALRQREQNKEFPHSGL